MRLLPLLLLALTLPTFAVAPNGAAAATQAASPDEALLKSKGLTKVGGLFLLEGDVKLADKLRAMRTAAAQVNSDTKRREELDRELRAVTDTIVDLYAQVHDLEGQHVKPKNVARHNEVAAQVNTLIGQIEQAERYRSDREKELQKMPDPRDTYVTAVLETSELMETTAARYQTLATDPAIKAALDHLSGLPATTRPGPSPHYRLGPSPVFASALPEVRKERKLVDDAVVTFVTENGVPHVDVTLNGTDKCRMVLDSGAASVVLTGETYNKLNLAASDKDRTVKLVVADGRTVDARLVILPSIRVAQYTVENVECAVLPPGVKGENLLGGTFLRHFSYRMDLAAGQLRMFQVSGKPTTALANAGRATGPTTAPDPAAATTRPTAPQPQVQVVSVPATRNDRDPVSTNLTLGVGDTFTLEPNLNEKWCGGGTQRGVYCDYRGYPGNANGWMSMHWKVGDTDDTVVAGARVKVTEPGELQLYASDGRPGDNEGAIHVSIAITRAAPSPTSAPSTQPAPAPHADAGRTDHVPG